MQMWTAVWSIVAVMWVVGVWGQDCEHLAQCSGHGTCDGDSLVCNCISGWGASTDIATFKAPDCSVRTCPAGVAWADIPTSTSTGHALAECSNAGICNRLSGTCECFDAFEGTACQRSKCPNDCSGHGKCVNIKALQAEPNAEPFGHSDGSYGGAKGSYTWDEDSLYGCLCQSSWAVGYGDGETQASEWFGPDCSRRRCPSGDDPRTFARAGQTDHQWYDETNCFLKDQNGFIWRGPLDSDGLPAYTRYTDSADFYANVQTGAYNVTDAANSQYVNYGTEGNLCHVDCSNRGYCDYTNGQCACFTGYYGAACEKSSVLATGGYRKGRVQLVPGTVDIAALARNAAL